MVSFSRITFTCIILFSFYWAIAQKGNFVDWQKSNANAVFKQKEDTHKKQFNAAGITWPAAQIYIHSIKYDSQMEVWTRNKPIENFKPFETYKIYALSRLLGSNRMEDDYVITN